MSIINLDLIQISTQRVLKRCEILAEISQSEQGIHREYLSAQHLQCNQQVATWMAEAGMDTWQDAVGNQWGRLISNNKSGKRLLMGSHLDTVPNAGAYDGILGVLLAVEIAHLANEQGLTLPFHFDVVGFCDEEGTRFGATLIGSQALAGNFKPQWLSLQDSHGKTMGEAFVDFGLDPDGYELAELNADELLAYWEVHIEQGPILESLNQPLGVVTAIAGARRAALSFSGRSGHAGTTPMNLRSDSIVAAAELTLAIEQLARSSRHGEVATVGRIETKPGVANVIAGRSEMSLDVRAQDDEHLDNIIKDIRYRADLIARQRGLGLTWNWTHEAPPVACDKNIQNLFQRACIDHGDKAPLLPSGAGHDAMAIAPLCPIGMLFIRSPGGVSHHPNEDVMHDDVSKAIAATYSALVMAGERAVA